MQVSAEDPLHGRDSGIREREWRIGMCAGRGPTGFLLAGVRRWPGFLQKAAPGPAGQNGRMVTGVPVPAVSEPQDGDGKASGWSWAGARNRGGVVIAGSPNEPWANLPKWGGREKGLQ